MGWDRSFLDTGMYDQIQRQIQPDDNFSKTHCQIRISFPNVAQIPRLPYQETQFSLKLRNRRQRKRAHLPRTCTIRHFKASMDHTLLLATSLTSHVFALRSLIESLIGEPRSQEVEDVLSALTKVFLVQKKAHTLLNFAVVREIEANGISLICFRLLYFHSRFPRFFRCGLQHLVSCKQFKWDDDLSDPQCLQRRLFEESTEHALGQD